MSCNDMYEELMSMKLDGLLGPDDERLLLAHIEDCTDCAVIWAVMTEADALLILSAKAPVAPSVGFQAAVMYRVAASPVYRPQYAPASAELIGSDLLPSLGSVLPDFSSLPAAGVWLISTETLLEWQHRLRGALRGAAAVVLSLAGTVGFMLALIAAGILKADGPISSTIGTVKTFFGAVNTWLLSIFSGVGGEVITVSALVMGLMALVGWQMVSGYHRTAIIENSSVNLA